MKLVMVAVAVGLAALSNQAHSADNGSITDPQLVQLIADKAKEYNVPLPLALGVIEAESGFRVRAHNEGNWGLGQIRCGTARSIGMTGSCKQLLDPQINLTYSMAYLRAALNEAHDDYCYALTLYNGGFGRGRKTSAYCKHILRSLDMPQGPAIVKHKQKHERGRDDHF
jgi:soluble lytic murein transglycosylase-like protein